MNESFDLVALSRFLADIEPAFADADAISCEKFSGGASNLTALISAGGRKLVVRRAPPGKKAATAHDMVREARVITAIRPYFPLAPKVVAVGEDSDILGTCFFIMEYLDGKSIGRKLPGDVTPEQARTLCEKLIDLHADLHGLDLAATGLESMGKAEGYVQRQIEGWTKRYRNAKTDDVPDFEHVIRWLHDNMPKESGASLIHNDFKFDNMILAHDDLTRIIGVVDWEMAAIGDPLMDLGASLAYWVQQDDPDTIKAVRTLPTTTPGMMTRDEVIAHYAKRTGRIIDDFTYYHVYGLFRLAGIAQQIYARFKLGQTQNPRFAGFGMAVSILADQAEQIVRTRS